MDEKMGKWTDRSVDPSTQKKLFYKRIRFFEICLKCLPTEKTSGNW